MKCNIKVRHVLLKSMAPFWNIWFYFPNRGYSLHLQQGKTFISRSSRLEVLRKKGVLRNFTKFTGKHLCKSPFFNRVAGPRSATLLKRDSGTGVFL